MVMFLLRKELSQTITNSVKRKLSVGEAFVQRKGRKVGLHFIYTKIVVC